MRFRLRFRLDGAERIIILRDHWRMQEEQQQRSLAATALPCVVGMVLLAIVLTEALHSNQPTRPARIEVGPKDQVYYLHSATKTDAEMLGRALRDAGFLAGLGGLVRLSKGSGGTVISFICDESALDDPEAAFAFEELGRRVAASIGGLPIKVRLMDSKWAMRKELSVGKVMIGARDEVYYFGSATALDAEALGQALRSARYLIDAGTRVVLSKNRGTVISLVVVDGAWDNRDQVSRFERLAGAAAASVGGLPITLHLLNSKMQDRKRIEIRAIPAQGYR